MTSIDPERNRLRRVVAIALTIAVAILWFTLYQAAPLYPPRLEWPLALAAVFFLCGVALLHRLHGHMWPRIAQFGFAVSAIGLALWTVGGAMNTLAVRAPGAQSALGRFALELLAQPQPGWGLFCVGLVPIGFGAIRKKLPLPMQLLLPLGCLFLLGPPLKYLFGENTGGMIVFAGFGVGWLAIGALLLVDADRRTP